MYQQKTNKANPKGTRQIFSSNVSDSFVSYEHAKNPENTIKGLGNYNGSNLALWALGASKFGHIETAQKEAEKIKGGNY